MYIESIFFSGGDISKQLPDEYNMFVQVNENFQTTMADANSDSRVKSVCCDDTEKLKNLREMNKTLEKIQKSLDQVRLSSYEYFANSNFYVLTYSDYVYKVLGNETNDFSQILFC